MWSRTIRVEPLSYPVHRSSVKQTKAVENGQKGRGDPAAWHLRATLCESAGETETGEGEGGHENANQAQGYAESLRTDRFVCHDLLLRLTMIDHCPGQQLTDCLNGFSQPGIVSCLVCNSKLEIRLLNGFWSSKDFSVWRAFVIKGLLKPKNLFVRRASEFEGLLGSKCC